MAVPTSSNTNTVPAIFNTDYSLTRFGLSLATLLFPPHIERLPVQLNLLPSSREVHRVEFQLTLAAVDNSPLFQPPDSLFESTLVTVEGRLNVYLTV